VNLSRFVDAQDRDGIYDHALAEVENGAKVTHWMWFVYPQLGALGRSATAKHFGIADLEEARSYLRHPLLGPRLRECAWAAAAVEVGRIEDAFGPTDTIKLRSSMTLFEAADPEEPSFRAVLDRHFDGRRDEATLDLLA
jgi:uncharacterized protein (DUF1810 family)